MRRLLALALSGLWLAIPATLSAGELTPDEQAFFEQQASKFVRFETEKIDDLAVEKVFAVPFFNLKMIVKISDGEQSSVYTVARVGDTIVPLLKPSTDGELSEFQKLLNPELKLRSNAEAKAVHQALNVLYPPFMASEKKLLSFRKAGNSWVFVRGEFFESKSGYVFDIEADGTIKAVRYMLRLP